MAKNNVAIGQAAGTYAMQFYEALVERATTETLPTFLTEGDFDRGMTHVSDGREVLVFRGKLTDVFTELGLSQIYYSKIRTILLEYGCVEYLQRGTKAYPSVLVLHHAPPPPGEISPELLTSGEDSATLGEVEQRVAALEDWRESTTGGLNIGDALRNMEKRLARLERATNGKKP